MNNNRGRPTSAQTRQGVKTRTNVPLSARVKGTAKHRVHPVLDPAQPASTDDYKAAPVPVANTVKKPSPPLTFRPTKESPRVAAVVEEKLQPPASEFRARPQLHTLGLDDGGLLGQGPATAAAEVAPLRRRVDVPAPAHHMPSQLPQPGLYPFDETTAMMVGYVARSIESSRIAYASASARGRGMSHYSPRKSPRRLAPLAAQAPSASRAGGEAEMEGGALAADAEIGFDRLYADKAQAFYLEALRRQAVPPAAPAAAPAVASGLKGMSGLRRGIATVVVKRRSYWDHFFSGQAASRDAGEDGGDFEDMRRRFREHTADAMRALQGGGEGQGGNKAQSKSERNERKKYLAERQRVQRENANKHIEDGTLRSHFPNVWDKRTSPAWGRRSGPAWGGLGWHYLLAASGEPGSHSCKPGWEDAVGNVAAKFDERHGAGVARAHKLVAEHTGPNGSGHGPMPEAAVHLSLFALRSNKLPVQPLRFDTTNLSPRSNTLYAAQEDFSKRLALSDNHGGPLVPVYAPIYDDGKLLEEAEEEPEEEPEEEWDLYHSIWGPRCEWCDGKDFYDHNEIVFERFATEWQMVLRLGVAKLVTDNDNQGAADADGDGVPDEVEDVGAVMFMHNQLTTLMWFFYADAIYGAGDNLDTGIKQNEGFKSMTEEAGIWTHLSTADAAVKNNSIYMSADKMDSNTAAAVAIQATYRGSRQRKNAKPKNTKASDPNYAPAEAQLDDAAAKSTQVEEASKAAIEASKDSSNDFRSKADRQLSRAEFTAALIKMAIERFVKSKQNPDNVVEDVSDAIEMMFSDFLEPALFRPLPGCVQPKLPLPDGFRVHGCYTQAMSKVLLKAAPSLRLIFTGLSKLTYEASRGSGDVTLPKPGKNKEVKRDGGAKWVIVPGHVSFSFWKKFLECLNFVGLNVREIPISPPCLRVHVLPLYALPILPPLVSRGRCERSQCASSTR